MIYLSFNVPQAFFPIRIEEMHIWNDMSKKFNVPIVPVFPGALYSQKTDPIGVFNMMGPVNTSHYRFLKILESRGVRYINDIESSAKADDKFLSALECSKFNIRTPKNVDLNILAGIGANLKGEVTERIESQLGFPCAIKYPVGGYGQGHFLAKDKVEFGDLYSIIALTNSKFGLWESGIDFFAQEFINNDGKFCPSIRILMWKGEIVHCFVRQSSTHWKTNLTLPASNTTADHFHDIDRPIDSELQYIADTVYKVYNLNLAGLDIFETDKGYVLGEINSSPSIFSNTFNVFGKSGFNPFEEIVKELLG